MKLTLYRKYLLITIGITLVFIVVGGLASFLATNIEREKFEGGPHLMFAHLIDTLAETQKISAEQALKILQTAAHESQDRLLMGLSIEDRTAFAKAKDLSLKEVPETPYAVKTVKGFSLGPPSEILVGLKSAPDKILVARFRPHPWRDGGPGPNRGPGDHFGPPPEGFPPGPPPRQGPPPQIGLLARGPKALTVNLIALVISVVLASAVSLFILFYSMREKAALTSGIIQRLKSGDLKARFPLTRMDEVGKIMMEFNRMADEIEALVERIRTSERGRMALLQELAHDLRTPVASLKSLLETLVSRKGKLSEEARDELMELSLREIQYFERLIDDLLFLAQVAEPKLVSQRQTVELKPLIEDELEAVEARYASSSKPIQVNFDVAEELPEIKGDHHLLRRMVRNALENAFSFARSTITVSVVPALTPGAGVEIRVLDDGPGLEADALRRFGEKRTTRKIDAHEGGRLSVGLGSVIMRAVAQSHEGHVRMANRVNAEGKRLGAELVITLPTQVMTTGAPVAGQTHPHAG